MNEIILNSTWSLCPLCLSRIPAWNVRRGENVFLVKRCPQHGRWETVIWRGAPEYEHWGFPKASRPPKATMPKKAGCPFDCGLCPEHKHSPCAVLLEVTDRCNLRCPVCFANAGQGKTPSLQEIASWYKTVSDTVGLVNIQLSGGEPTTRDDLPEIVRMGKAHGFPFIQANTNGIRIAQKKDYARALRDAGLDCAFLQFDGLTDPVYERLRGARLLDRKLAAIEHCAELGIGIVLVATVHPHVNLSQLGELFRFALSKVPFVRGLHIQPIGYMGRHPSQPQNEDRVTLPEIIRALEAQTGGLLQRDIFLPPAGENAHCSFHANLIVMPDGSLLPWVNDTSSFARAKKELSTDGSVHAQHFMARQWSAAGKEEEHDDELGTLLGRMKRHTLSLSCMAFQDVWNIDLERLKECHIAILSHDQRIVPFCAYNLTSCNGKALYRCSTNA